MSGIHLLSGTLQSICQSSPNAQGSTSLAAKNGHSDWGSFLVLVIGWLVILLLLKVHQPTGITGLIRHWLLQAET